MKRNKENYFDDITGTNKSIASNIMNNLDNAIYNQIDYKKIGKKIYNSKANKENIKDKSYIEMEKIIEEYLNEMISNSMVDDSISIYLYNQYLLKNKLYKEQLLNRYKYLFIDDLQNISVSQVNLIKEFDNNEKEIFVYCDHSRYFSSFIKNDINYVYKQLLGRDETYSNIGVFDLINENASIELDQSSQLYGEMIENISQNRKLISNGVSKKIL